MELSTAASAAQVQTKSLWQDYKAREAIKCLGRYSSAFLWTVAKCRRLDMVVERDHIPTEDAKYRRVLHMCFRDEVFSDICHGRC